MLIDKMIHHLIYQSIEEPAYILSAYFLQKRFAIQHTTLKQAAADTSISQSSIVRFVQLLGEENYTFFQTDVIKELITLRIQQEKEAAQKDLDQHKQLSLFLQQELTPKALHTCGTVAALMRERKRVCILCTLSDLPLYEALAERFFSKGIFVEVCCLDLPQREVLPSMEDTIFLLMSSRLSIQHMLECFLRQPLASVLDRIMMSDAIKVLISITNTEQRNTICIEFERPVFELHAQTLIQLLLYQIYLQI